MEGGGDGTKTGLTAPASQKRDASSLHFRQDKKGIQPEVECYGALVEGSFVIKT